MQAKPTLLKILDFLAIIMLAVSTYFALIKAPITHVDSFGIRYDEVFARIVTVRR